MTIRQWLRANNYQDVDHLIGAVMAAFAAEGSKERRNWADALSGGKDGKPTVIAGRTFPVLASAQRSRKKPVTANAIQRNENEEFPAVRSTGRWPRKRRLPTKLAKLSKQKSKKSQRAKAS